MGPVFSFEWTPVSAYTPLVEHVRVRGTLARSANPFEMEKKQERKEKGKRQKGLLH